MNALTLGTLKPAKGSRKDKTRKGRGVSSGKGRYSSRGRKGSGQRSGNSKKVGFEGGQMPLVRRLPKRGFNNKKFEKKYEIVNLIQIQNKFKSGDVVDQDKLAEMGLISGKYTVKILAKGEIKKKIKVSKCSMSAAAKDKIEKAGGTVNA